MPTPLTPENAQASKTGKPAGTASEDVLAVVAVRLTAPSVDKRPTPTDVPAALSEISIRWFVLVLSEVGDPAVPEADGAVDGELLAVALFQMPPTAWSVPLSFQVVTLVMGV